MTYANMNPDDFCRTCNGVGTYRYEDQREGRTVTVTDSCWACNGTGCKVFYLNGCAAVVSTETGDGFEPARRALQDVKSSREVIAAAVDVLSASTLPDDIQTVRVWRNHLWAKTGAELNAAARAKLPDQVPFDEILMPFTTPQIALLCVLLGAALIIMTVGHYLLWGMADAL